MRKADVTARLHAWVPLLPLGHSYIDALLARLDGAVAPIWISLFAEVSADAGAAARLHAAAHALVAAVPRLQQRWEEARGAFVPVHRNAAALDAMLLRAAAPRPAAQWIEEALSRRCDLTRDIPWRLGLLPLPDGRALFVSQLHHALSDAKGHALLLRRLFAEVAGTPPPAIAPAQLSDRRLLAAVIGHAPALRLLADPASRLFAARGLRLPVQPDPGPPRPLLCTVRLRLPSGDGAAASAQAPADASLPGAQPHPEQPSAADVFHAGLLAAAAATAGPQPPAALLRLRVPIDLRRPLGLAPALENAAAAIPIEIPLSAIRAAVPAPAPLADLLRTPLQAALRAGLPFASTTESMALSHLASRARLRAGAAPGLDAAPRPATLVVTYVGDLAPLFAHAPFTVHALQGHTPTWGATGVRFGDQLSINLTGFTSAPGRAALRQFADALAAWAGASGAARAIEVVGP